MATFQIAPTETHDLLTKVITDCYPDLVELMNGSNPYPVTFDILNVFADQDANGEPVGPAIKSRGWPVQADISITNKANRALGRADILIRIDADRWKDLPDDQREALLDHEIYHLIPVKDKDDNWKKDDLGHQQFRMRDHDVEVGWFIAVAQRRTSSSPEVIQARRIADKWGQFLFFFGDTQPLPLKAGKRAAAPAEAEPELPREWRLWQQLNADEQEYASDNLGDTLNPRFQFRVVVGGLCEQAPLGEPSTAENETEAPPAKKGRGRKAAAKTEKGGRK